MPTIRLSPTHIAASSGSRTTLQRLVALWQMRRRTRLALGRLDAHLLKDVGLHENSAREEAEKPFWIA